jgi:CTP:molybdopterin cytidylyltransferase MocA
MVGSVVDEARAAGMDPVIVVTGFHADDVETVVPSAATVVRNPDPGRGNMSSLLTGIATLRDVDAVVILLSDMPGVIATSISAVCTAVQTTDAMFAWTRYADGRGHPIAISSRGMGAIGHLVGEKALWPFFDSLDAATFVEVLCDGVRPTDVNTPEDYEAAVAPVVDEGTLGT